MRTRRAGGAKQEAPHDHHESAAGDPHPPHRRGRDDRAGRADHATPRRTAGAARGRATERRGTWPPRAYGHRQAGRRGRRRRRYGRVQAARRPYGHLTRGRRGAGRAQVRRGQDGRRKGPAKAGVATVDDPRPTGSRSRTATTPAERRTRRPATPRKPPPKGGATTKPVNKPTAKPAAASKSARPAVRRSVAPPRAPFVLLVVGLLGGALVSLLLLNTVLAQDAFTLSELQRSNQQLSERKQALQDDINRENSPAVLHAKARGLGMVDGQRPAFIDARSGRVTEGGTRPPGVSDEAMAAAAGAGVTGAPGAIMPPAGGRTPHGGGRAGGGTR